MYSDYNIWPHKKTSFNLAGYLSTQLGSKAGLIFAGGAGLLGSVFIMPVVAKRFLQRQKANGDAQPTVIN